MNGSFDSRKGLLIIMAMGVIVGVLWIFQEDKRMEASIMDSPDAPAGSYEANEKIFIRQCTACHAAGPFDRHKAGPNLWDVAGRKKASKGGYRYSKALKAAKGTWTGKDLNKFLTNPMAFLPGTKMIFKGLVDPRKRAAVIAYLQEQVPGGAGQEKKADR